MFRPGSPAFLPNLTALDAVTTDEGSSINVSATAAPPIAKPWIELFELFPTTVAASWSWNTRLFQGQLRRVRALDKGWLRLDSIRQSGRIMAVVRSRTPQHAREPALVRRFQLLARAAGRCSEPVSANPIGTWRT